MRWLLGLAFLLTIAISARAIDMNFKPDHYRIRVIVADVPGHIDLATADYMMTEAEGYFKDLGVKIKWDPAVKVVFPEGLVNLCTTLEFSSRRSCLDELKEWHKFNGGKRGITTAFLFPPMYGLHDGRLYFAGIANTAQHWQAKLPGCAAVNKIGTMNSDGVDYTIISAKIIAHEIAHCIGANHVANEHPGNDRLPDGKLILNIMDPAACGHYRARQRETGFLEKPKFIPVTLLNIKRRDKKYYRRIMRKRVRQQCLGRPEIGRCIRRLKKRLEK